MAHGILVGNCCANFDNEIWSAIRRATMSGCFPARRRLQRKPIRLNVQYSGSRRKIRGLPNNRTNEMIRGCEIRSISGRRPSPRPLYDDSVERRLVVHGFRR
jgi:hypothetical protein